MLVSNRKTVPKQAAPPAWSQRSNASRPFRDPRILRFELCGPYQLAFLLALFAAFTPRLFAATVDLTTANSGTVNGAIFLFTEKQPTGTGLIDPFLRLQSKVTEQGYNTSGRPVAFDEKGPLNFTHDLKVSDLGSTNSGGDVYYMFLLDINDPATPKKRMLSLDSLQIFTSATGSLTTTNVSSLGTLRYNLDAGACETEQRKRFRRYAGTYSPECF